MNKAYYKNKNILIIGGSFGIGHSLCKKLAQNQANLAISARSTAIIEQLANELTGNHFAISCDICKADEVDNLHKEIKKKWRQIDLIIFCAGIYKPMGINNFDFKSAKDVYEVNFGSFVIFLDKFLEYFKQGKIEHLAIISSIAGYFGMPNSLCYGASKAALSNFAQSLHYELKKYNTKVQLINPGFVKTRLTDKNNFNMPGIISADRAADIIVDKLPKNVFEIKFPWAFSTFMKILSLLPQRLRFLILKGIDK